MPRSASLPTKHPSANVSWRALASLIALAAVLFITSTPTSAQQPSKPKIPPGRDPGGLMIGLITTGIDPTRPEVARCLARDGEGELIGWDVIDRDRAPFRRTTPGAPGTPGDESFFLDIPCGRVRIVPVRAAPSDPVSIAKALSFLATTPVRTVVIPTTSQPDDMGTFWQAATAFSQLVIVLAATKELPETKTVNVVPVAAPDAMQHALKLTLCGDKAPSTAPDPACR